MDTVAFFTCLKTILGFLPISLIFIRAIKDEAVRKMNKLGRNPNDVSRLVRKMKIESTDVVG